MRKLRDIIEDEEQKIELIEDSEQIKKQEKASIQVNQTKIKKVQKQTHNSILKFPELYLDDNLMDIAIKINDSFLLNLKSDKKITRESLDDVLPEFILAYPESNQLSKNILEDIKQYIINNIIGLGVITTLFEIAKDGLNDVIVNTKDYVDIIKKLLFGFFFIFF